MSERNPEFFVHSLARGLLVIDSFSADRTSQTIADVSHATGLTRVASRRALLTLAELGYARQQSRQFSLTPKVLDLGYSFLSSLPVVSIAEEPMERLVNVVKVSSSIAILDDLDIVYVARVPAGRIMTIPLALGSRLPAYATSMGRVLLAGLPDPDLKKVLRRTTFERLTRRTIADRETLWSVLMEVRASGYALVNQELELGLRSIAVPIVNTEGMVIAAMNLSFRASGATPRDIRRIFLPQLIAAANEVSDRLQTLRIG